MNPWRQRCKWVVYALLVVNFIVYLHRDIESARATLDAGSGWLDVLAAYATSLDLAAWFMLILLFEIETGPLAGRAWPGGTQWAVRGLRLACYVAIVHTSFANGEALRELYAPGGGTALADAAGLREARMLAWTYLAESLAWLAVMLATELIVRLQPASRAGIARVAGLAHVKTVLYVLIFAIAAYWGAKGELLYFWDELLWLLGFSMIDWNIRDWRRRTRRLFSASPSAA
jgi:hypothetical protein